MEETKNVDVVENYVFYLVTGSVTYKSDQGTSTTYANAFIHGKMELGVKGVVAAQKAIKSIFEQENNREALAINIINIIPIRHCTREEFQQECYRMHNQLEENNARQ